MSSINIVNQPYEIGLDVPLRPSNKGSRASETAEEKEERMRKHKIRDRARWETESESGSPATRKGQNNNWEWRTERGKATENAHQS